ncbi:MAG: GIY-YIG nuclease family protein [Candidatus Baltobacteraceae bacterium]
MRLLAARADPRRLLSMKLYYEYMLICADRSFYIGITNDLERRVGEHEFGLDRLCYTFERRPVKLVYSADFHHVDEAIAWEKQLKGWSRAKKTAFVSGNMALVHELAKRSRR